MLQVKILLQLNSRKSQHRSKNLVIQKVLDCFSLQKTKVHLATRTLHEATFQLFSTSQKSVLLSPGDVSKLSVEQKIKTLLGLTTIEGLSEIVPGNSDVV